MTENNLPEIVSKIVALLAPLAGDERTRIFRASMALLGEEIKEPKEEADSGASEGTEMPARVRAWIKQNALSMDEIQQVFHQSEEGVSFIADVPGKSNKEKVLNSYLLTGISMFLQTGDPKFDDKAAKALCESTGCFDSTNHAKYLKDKGNEFTGSKEKGWSLTSPGLKRGAQLVKELSAVN